MADLDVTFDLARVRQAFPEIDPTELHLFFPRMDVSSRPELAGWTWEACHRGAMGPGGAFLACDMARTLGLSPGQRVLDLGAGKALSSVFLARAFGVQVVAADLWIDPSTNAATVRDAGLEHAIVPLRVDARDLPFPSAWFDAVFCMDAYHYFGTDAFFAPTLEALLKPGGRLCIGGPCYAVETDALPASSRHRESAAYHCPTWWATHLSRTSSLVNVSSREHPDGRALWLDFVRWELEEKHPRERTDWTGPNLLDNIVMLAEDADELNTHFILTAEAPA